MYKKMSRYLLALMAVSFVAQQDLIARDRGYEEEEEGYYEESSARRGAKYGAAAGTIPAVAGLATGHPAAVLAVPATSALGAVIGHGKDRRRERREERRRRREERRASRSR